MELNSISSQVYPRAVNAASGGQSRRQHNDDGERVAAQQQQAKARSTSEPAQAHDERSPGPSRADDHGQTRDVPPPRSEPEHRAFHGESASSEVQERHAEAAPATVARRAERSYLNQVPTEQGRIIDEMV